MFGSVLFNVDIVSATFAHKAKLDGEGKGKEAEEDEEEQILTEVVAAEA